jgi:predicted O-linked N-acetylglucosamine transferase (SPINDLY family)
MDYRLTDPHAAPSGLTDELHTESLWRLPRTQWCYRPYDFAPEVGTLPASANGFITFATFNNPAKVQPTIVALWAQIMRKLPEARLLLGTASQPRRRAELDAYFAAHGIAAGRVTQIGWRPTAEYLALYAQADIALDTWPYAGGTTTCDALWMGVPVVTLAGDRTFSRSGASILSNVGLPELVAATQEQYVAAAVALAQDAARLAEMRRGLRARMQASPLTDAAQFARDIETAYIMMWQRELTRAAGEGR